MNDDETGTGTFDDEDLGHGPGVSEVEAVEDGSGALRAEIADLDARLLYAQAETQNVRRRLEKEKADAQAYAATGFARDMLSIADNLTRALAAIPESLRADEKMKPLVTGIEMTAKELETTFQRQGITRIAALGEPLDPNRHQAIMEVESAQHAPGTIVHEMQTGWMIRDRLLRPAMVGVAKAAESPKVDATA